jgi:hypothetical protein
MRNRLHEIIAGRTASAWRRRTERSTAWLREFSVASSWLAARAALDAAYWNASPFGARLAEVTAAGRHSSSSASAPRHPSAQSAPLQETARVRSRDVLDHARAPMPVPRSRAGAAVAGHDPRSHREASMRSGGARARSRDMPDHARAPMPVPRSRAGAAVAGRDQPSHREASMRSGSARARGRDMPDHARAPIPVPRSRAGAAVAGHDQRSHHEAGTRSSAISRAQLTALAGKLPRALRSASSRARDAEHLMRSLGATHGGDGRKRTEMDAASSSAALARRMTARLDRAFTRTFGQPLSTTLSPDLLPGPIGWNVAMAPPENNLALAAPLVSNSVTPSLAVDPVALPLQQDLNQPPKTSGMASAARAQSNANDPSLTSWKRPIAAPEPALTLSSPEAAAVEIAATAAPTPRAGVQPSRHETLSRQRHAAPFDAPSSGELSDAWPSSPSGTQTRTGAGASSEIAPASAQNDLGSAPARGAEPAGMRPGSFQPLVVAPRYPPAPRTAAEASGAPWAATRPAFDQVEFAEYLRRALVDDARRYGIDV